MYRLGYDIGGTFTDLILVDDDSGAAHTLKVPSTPAAPADGALDGLLRLTRAAGVEPAAVRYLAHGSTVALNAILEGKTARVGLDHHRRVSRRAGDRPADARAGIGQP